MIQITIFFYGAFRPFGTSVIIEIQGVASVNDLRPILVQKIGREHEALVYDSVFANDTDILTDGATITESCALSILPPVCGG